MSDGLTVQEVKARCVELADRIGPEASVCVNIGKFSDPYLFLMPKVRGDESETFWAEDWDSLFAKAEAWIAARPNPDAEYASWGVAA